MELIIQIIHACVWFFYIQNPLSKGQCLTQQSMKNSAQYNAALKTIENDPLETPKISAAKF